MPAAKTNFVELTAVQLNEEREWLATRGIRVSGRDLDLQSDGPEEDDLEQPIERAAPATEDAFPPPSGVYYSVMVNPDDVREFYPRKAPLEGTRIVYKNGAARPVKELFAEVKAAFLGTSR
jgi:hypothetical protein